MEQPSPRTQTLIYPKGWMAIRIIQLLLSVCNISLNVYLITAFNLTYGPYAPNGPAIPTGPYVIFSCVCIALPLRPFSDSKAPLSDNSCLRIEYRNSWFNVMAPRVSFFGNIFT